jgi:hypothetical protein
MCPGDDSDAVATIGWTEDLNLNLIPAYKTSSHLILRGGSEGINCYVNEKIKSPEETTNFLSRWYLGVIQDLQLDHANAYNRIQNFT